MISLVGGGQASYDKSMNKRPLPHSIAHPELVYIQAMPTGGGSDHTLKKNIEDLPFSLDRVLALRPVTWEWRDEAAGRQKEYGFVAQELENELPDLVYNDVWMDGTTRKFISSQALLPYLIAAIQELQAEIDDLKDKLSQS